MNQQELSLHSNEEPDVPKNVKSTNSNEHNEEDSSEDNISSDPQHLSQDN